MGDRTKIRQINQTTIRMRRGEATKMVQATKELAKQAIKSHTAIRNFFEPYEVEDLCRSIDNIYMVHIRESVKQLLE